MRQGFSRLPETDGEIVRAHSFALACARDGIDHRLTKPYHPWTNGQIERMNRTLKEATGHRHHDGSHDEPSAHLALLLDADTHPRPIKTPKAVTPDTFMGRRAP